MKSVHNLSTVILGENTSFQTEQAYIRLRTNFIYTTMNGQYKAIVFTSCIAGEGKSTTVLNLAISLAAIDKKVIVIDCDMRKSLMRHYIKHEISRDKGLSLILSNQATWKDCVENIDKYGFDMIYAGEIVPNPSELLASENMKQLIAELKEEYDYVLLDLPPVLAVSDPVIVSSIADGTIFVIRHEKVNKRQLKASVNALQLVNANLLGTVLDQYDAQKDYTNYGYKGYKYYRYHYYYNDSYGYGEGKK